MKQQIPQQQQSSHESPLAESGFDGEGSLSMAPPPFQLFAGDPPTDSDSPGVLVSGLESKTTDATEMAQASNQLQEDAGPVKTNQTGIPDDLKLSIEQLSGFSLDDVRVHYNSSKPAELGAHAYAVGLNVYIGPGQEKHLAHELWHVVQQMQGRVRATTTVNGQGVNDDEGLEREADEMGRNTLNMPDTGSLISFRHVFNSRIAVQRKVEFDPKMENQYTYGEYLRQLLIVARSGEDLKKLKEFKPENSDLTEFEYDLIEKIWIYIVELDEKVTLDGDFAKSWGKIKNVISRKEMDFQKIYQKHTEDRQKANLDKFNKEVSKTSQSGHEERVKAIRRNIGSIYPSLTKFDKKTLDLTPGNLHDPYVIPNPLKELIDYHTWDNLSETQREELIDYNATKDKFLQKKLIKVVTEGKNSDFIFAILTLFKDDDEALLSISVTKEKVQTYLNSILQIKKGVDQSPSPNIKLPGSNADDDKAKKWQKLIPKEHMPFHKQREELNSGNKNILNDQEKLVIRKWATANTNVQKNASNLGSDISEELKTEDRKNENITNVDLVTFLDFALKKLPPIKGKVFGAYPFNPSLKEGFLFVQGGNMSASESEGGTATFSKGEDPFDRYVITAKGFNGIPIAQLAPGDGQHQREVLFRACAKFKVTKIEEGEFGANVSRLVYMEELPGTTKINELPEKRIPSIYSDKHLKESQRLLLDEKSSWVTKVNSFQNLLPQAQRWFLSNFTGGYIEDSPTATAQFPYGKQTAEQWHTAINTEMELNELFSIEGFRKIAGLIRGEAPQEVHIIKKHEDPGGWGQAEKREDEEIKILEDLGMDVKRKYRVKDIEKIDQGKREEFLAEYVSQSNIGELEKDQDGFMFILLNEKKSGLQSKVFTINEFESKTIIWLSYDYKPLSLEEDSNWKEMVSLLNIQSEETVFLGKNMAACEGLQLIEEEKNNVKVKYKSENKEKVLKKELKKFNKKAQKISSDNNGEYADAQDPCKKDQQTLRFAAEVQQKLSVIHPMHDGNGRLSRAYAYQILRVLGNDIPKEKYPTFNQDDDQTTSKRDWEDQFSTAYSTGNLRQETKYSQSRRDKFKVDNLMKDLLELESSKLVEELKSQIDKTPPFASHWVAAFKERVRDFKLAEESPDKLHNIPRELMLLTTQESLGAFWTNQARKGLKEDIQRAYISWKKNSDSKAMHQMLKLRDEVLTAMLKLMNAPSEERNVGMDEESGIDEFGPGKGNDSDRDQDYSKGDDSHHENTDGMEQEHPKESQGPANGGMMDTEPSPDEQEFEDRIQLINNAAEKWNRTASSADKQNLLNDIVNNYNESEHGISDVYKAYLVAKDQSQIKIRLETIYKNLIESSKTFFLGWEKPLENYLKTKRQDSGIPEGRNMDLESTWMQEFAERFYNNNIEKFSPSHQKTIQTALKAKKDYVETQAAANNILVNFEQGKQLSEGDCLFAALIFDNDEVSEEKALFLRKEIVSHMDQSYIENLNADELISPTFNDGTSRLESEAYNNLKTYIKLEDYKTFMSAQGTWGGDPEIRAWSSLSNKIVYLLEPGTCHFRSINGSNSDPSPPLGEILEEIKSGDAIAIQNIGGHYIRLLPKDNSGQSIDKNLSETPELLSKRSQTNDNHEPNDLVPKLTYRCSCGKEYLEKKNLDLHIKVKSGLSEHHTPEPEIENKRIMSTLTMDQNYLKKVKQ